MAVKSYRDLEVWKLSKTFARDVYQLTEQFPKDERFSLTQQVRRSVVSVMSNIAEGSRRISKQEFARFINIASGSLCEAESQLLLAVDLGYVAGDIIDELLLKTDRISKMLYALHESLSSTEYRVPSTEYA